MVSLGVQAKALMGHRWGFDRVVYFACIAGLRRCALACALSWRERRAGGGHGGGWGRDITLSDGEVKSKLTRFKGGCVFEGFCWVKVGSDVSL